MLTQENSDDNERIQKIVLKVVLGDQYTDYTTACQYLHVDTLAERRDQLCLNFALKCLKNPKFKDLFPQNIDNTYPNRHTEVLDVQLAKHARYQKSPVIFLQNLLNYHFKETGLKK